MEDGNWTSGSGRIQTIEIILSETAFSFSPNEYISFHDKAEVLEEILKEYPQIEIVQIQFNYVDYEDPAVESRKCYEVCPQHLQIRELLQDVAKEFEK